MRILLTRDDGFAHSALHKNLFDVAVVPVPDQEQQTVWWVGKPQLRFPLDVLRASGADCCGKKELFFETVKLTPGGVLDVLLLLGHQAGPEFMIDVT